MKFIFNWIRAVFILNSFSLKHYVYLSSKTEIINMIILKRGENNVELIS